VAEAYAGLWEAWTEPPAFAPPVLVTLDPPAVV
jgi:hypothetical protein